MSQLHSSFTTAIKEQEESRLTTEVEEQATDQLSKDDFSNYNNMGFLEYFGE